MSTTNATPHAQRSRIIEAFEEVSNLMRYTCIPGLGLGIIHAGDIIVSKGFGFADVDANIAVTDETPFAIGSLSKAFTAAACSALVADGKIDWNAPISNYFPNFQTSQEDKTRHSYTIAETLSHTTGLPDFSLLYLTLDGSLLCRGIDEGENIRKYFSNVPLQTEDFRQVWRYNALGYALLSMIIEQVSGLSFKEFISTRLLEPLGMRSTSLLHSALGEDQRTQVACPYIVLPDNSLKKIRLMEYGIGTHFAASCGVQSSIKDMLIWAQTIISCWNSEDGPLPMLAKDSPFSQELRRGLQPVCHFPPLKMGHPSYGFGWFHMVGQYISEDIFDEIPAALSQTEEIDQDSPLDAPSDGNNPVILYHAGWVRGFNSSIHIFPKTKDAIVVLGNSTGHLNGVDWISRFLISILHGDGPQDIQSGIEAEGRKQRDRWAIMNCDWISNKDPQKETPLIPISLIAGRYVNRAFGLEIHIFLSPLDDKLGFISFFADHSHSAELTHYHRNVYSFFLARDDFRERASHSFADYSQFLLHTHIEDDYTTGLWWQYAPSQDGIWFGREKLSVSGQG